MNHAIILPVLLPLVAAVLLLFAARRGLALQRALSLAATLTLLAVGVQLLMASAGGAVQVYALGNWPAPFGIVLVLDRLSALFVSLTAVVAAVSLASAVQGADAAGRHFHALFQLQLMGLNGAFLTGDLFNLFVFFEILLIASYGLLLHGGGAARLRAGIHYVIINLAASSLFLVAVALLYGVTGTLNMADLALRVAGAATADAGLIRAAALLLLVVFAVKAAVFPLYLWLPGAYSVAAAPVAALFAIMTKVGVYAIVRVYTLIFGADAGPAADAAAPWLLPFALATLALGMLGALAADGLHRLVAYLVVASTGTQLAAVGLFSENGIAASLYYLAHSTFALAALFLLAELIARQRGEQADGFVSAPAVAQPLLLGLLFLAGAAVVAGLPPFSGFLGKIMVLTAARGTPPGYWVWGTVLVAGLLGLIALSRAGSTLFWRTTSDQPPPHVAPARPYAAAPVVVLLAANVLLATFADPARAFVDAVAQQLAARSGYIESVLDLGNGR